MLFLTADPKFDCNVFKSIGRESITNKINIHQNNCSSESGEHLVQVTDRLLVFSDFLQNGEIVVNGHKLCHEDLRIMYNFVGDGDAENKYEAHSDNEVLVLLDITPSQDMLDEGVAREVVNRVQKLRKKARFFLC